MALAGRSSRRGAGARWLAIGIVVTLLVLLIDASLHSRSQSPGQQLAAGAWVDQALPVVATSNTEGQQLLQIWSHGLTMPSNQLATEMQQIAGGASQAYQQVVKLRPPTDLSGAAGLLEACLLARSQAALQLRSAINQALASPGSTAAAASTSTTAPGGTAAAGTTSVPGTSSSSPSPSSSPSSSTSTTVATTPSTGPGGVALLAAVQNAANDVQVGDQAYRLFQQVIPRSVGLRMPQSQWGANSSVYAPQTAQVFLDSLHNAASSSPVHQLKIYSIVTNPPPVARHGSTEVLPDATNITVTIVVADVGNQPESNLTVTASVAPSASLASLVRDFVNLTAGQAYTIVGLGPLHPAQGPPVVLTVTVSPPAGSSTPPVTETVALTMPAPPPPSTTTTSTVPSSTTSSTSTTPPTT